MMIRFSPFSFLLILSLSVSTFAATPAEIDKAIETGKAFLYSCQNPDGTWEPPTIEREQHGAVTSMCIYALLTAGDSEKDPRLAKAIQYIMKVDITGTYALGFESLALSKLQPTPQVKDALKKAAKRIIDGAARKGALGLYVYQYNSAGDYWDHSNSQYGLLGAWACAEAGIEFPDKYWEEVDNAWRTTGLPGGSWGYNADSKDPRLTMTLAGVATLFITDDFLKFKNPGDCKGNFNDKKIEDGIKWMIPHINEASDLYTWYGVERVGIASGYKYFGDVDWFKVEADKVVHAQRKDGSWEYNLAPVGTSYAVLFLYRGRAPIVMNKLRYDKDPSAADPIDGAWNERPRDAAGAAKFIGDQLESFMNWQVVSLAVDPDELHDSPILYLAGNEALRFSTEQEAKLRKFVEAGGLILGNADCGSEAFASSFKTLCEKLFEGKYHFRKLDEAHPIFSRQQFTYKSWLEKPLVEGLSNGAHELAVLIPTADPSKAWATSQFKHKHEMFELMADIYLYSVDRQNITTKGDTYIVEPDKSNPTRTVKLARLQYTGNWDPEPGGWRRLAAIMHNSQKINLTIAPVKPGDGQLSNYAIAHLTGTDAFELNDAARQEIRKFVEGGGTLIVDAAGGSTPFGDATDKELSTIFGPEAAGQLADPLPRTSPIFADLQPADIQYRAIVRSLRRGGRGSQIRGISIKGRVAVIFSREDLSAGLVGQSVDGIVGYAPPTASRLMANFIMYCMQPAPAPATQKSVPAGGSSTK